MHHTGVGRALSPLVTTELSLHVHMAYALPGTPPPPVQCPPSPGCASAANSVVSPRAPLWPTCPGAAQLSASSYLPSPPPPSALRGPPRDGTTIPLAITDWTSTGHPTQARPIRLGLGLRDPGQFMLDGTRQMVE